MVEPGAVVRRVLGREAGQVLHPALHALSAGADGAEAREAAVGAGEGNEADRFFRLVAQGGVHTGPLAPKREQGPVDRRQEIAQAEPLVTVQLDARPGPMVPAFAGAGEELAQREGRTLCHHPSCLATVWNHSTSGAGR
jgi:hypothetical protein